METESKLSIDIDLPGLSEISSHVFGLLLCLQTAKHDEISNCWLFAFSVTITTNLRIVTNQNLCLHLMTVRKLKMET